MEEMASYLRSYLRNVNSHCFDDSQWKIGAFLTNSFANKKKFRSRKKKIHFGLNQQPDCVVILNADRKSSVILEADRSQIPIPSLGDSTIPWESYKRITYPIPSRDTIEIVYFFCHSIMKTVIIEQKAMTVETKSRIKKTNSTFPRGTMVRGASSSTSSPKRGRGNYYWILVLLFTLAAVVVATAFVFLVFAATSGDFDPTKVWRPIVYRILLLQLGVPRGLFVMFSIWDKADFTCFMNPEGEPSVNGPHNQPPVSPETPSASEPSVIQEGIREVPFDNPPVFPEIDLNQPASSGLDPASPVQDVPEPPASPASNTNSAVVGSNVLPGESLESVAPRKRDLNQPAEDEDEDEVLSKPVEEEEWKERQASQNANPEPEEE